MWTQSQPCHIQVRSLASVLAAGNPMELSALAALPLACPSLFLGVRRVGHHLIISPPGAAPIDTDNLHPVPPQELPVAMLGRDKGLLGGQGRENGHWCLPWEGSPQLPWLLHRPVVLKPSGECRGWAAGRAGVRGGEPRARRGGAARRLRRVHVDEIPRSTSLRTGALRLGRRRARAGEREPPEEEEEERRRLGSRQRPGSAPRAPCALPARPRSMPPSPPRSGPLGAKAGAGRGAARRC